MDSKEMGKLGAKARQRNLTPERRREIAIKANKARNKKLSQAERTYIAMVASEASKKARMKRKKQTLQSEKKGV